MVLHIKPKQSVMQEPTLDNLSIDMKEVICIILLKLIINQLNLIIDIQTLMGMLLFVPNGIGTSPYSCMLHDEMWMEIYEIFIRDACNLLGVTVDSPLTTCINAGCTAIPALLNIKQVMMQRQVTGIWNGKDELPVIYFSISVLIFYSLLYF